VFIPPVTQIPGGQGLALGQPGGDVPQSSSTLASSPGTAGVGAASSSTAVAPLAPGLLPLGFTENRSGVPASHGFLVDLTQYPDVGDVPHLSQTVKDALDPKYGLVSRNLNSQAGGILKRCLWTIRKAEPGRTRSDQAGPFTPCLSDTRRQCVVMWQNEKTLLIKSPLDLAEHADTEGQGDMMEGVEHEEVSHSEQDPLGGDVAMGEADDEGEKRAGGDAEHMDVD